MKDRRSIVSGNIAIKTNPGLVLSRCLILSAEQECRYVFEAKTANTFVAHDWELDVPEIYQLQVQHYMAVTGFTGTYIVF